MARRVLPSFVEEDLTLAHPLRGQAKGTKRDLECSDYPLQEPYDGANAAAKAVG